jgi:alginate O-acetyltransferase complex protein AlgJ
VKIKVLLLAAYILFLATLAGLFARDIQNIDIAANSVSLFLKYSIAFAIASVLFLAINSIVRLKDKLKSFREATTYHIVLLALFSISVLLPLLGLALGTESRTINFENRKLVEKPVLSLNSLSSFANQYTAYFNDNFGFRKMLMSLNSYIKVKFLNTSTVPDVILGKRDWLYYRPGLEDSSGSTLFTTEELLGMKRAVESQSQWMAEKGIYYLIVIAPNKETIYPEYLPAKIDLSNHQTQLDQLLTAVGSSQNVHILDLRECLLKSKKSDDYSLYFRTDTHWNSYGAYIGYNEIIQKLADHFPNLILPSTFGPNISPNPIPASGDLANMLALHGILNENAPITVANGVSPEANKIPKVVVFRDSFFNALSPYFDINFKQTINYTAADKIDVSVLTNDPPQAVLVICVQRQMTGILGWVNQLIPAR